MERPLRLVREAVDKAWRTYLKRRRQPEIDSFLFVLQDTLSGAPGSELEWNEARMFRIELAMKFVNDAGKELD